MNIRTIFCLATIVFIFLSTGCAISEDKTIFLPFNNPWIRNPLNLIITIFVIAGIVYCITWWIKTYKQNGDVPPKTTEQNGDIPAKTPEQKKNTILHSWQIRVIALVALLAIIVFLVWLSISQIIEGKLYENAAFLSYFYMILAWAIAMAISQFLILRYIKNREKSWKAADNVFQYSYVVGALIAGILGLNFLPHFPFLLIYILSSIYFLIQAIMIILSIIKIVRNKQMNISADGPDHTQRSPE